MTAPNTVLKRLWLGWLFYLCSLLSPASATAQVPVADYLGRWISKTTSVISEVSQTIEALAEPLIDTYKKVQEHLKKAQTVVNIAFRNLLIIEDIVQYESDIVGIYTNAIRVINRPRDGDHDGLDDLFWLDKWKHLQILLALSKQSSEVFDLFVLFLTDDVFTMDDKNRLVYLQQIRKKLLTIRTAMRIEIRRINKEIYAFRKFNRERATFDQFFN